MGLERPESGFDASAKGVARENIRDRRIFGEIIGFYGKCGKNCEGKEKSEVKR
jgi:hypothetical protein